MKNITILFSMVLTVAAQAGNYRIGSGEITARVEHPFQVVELTTGEIRASLSVDASDPNLARGATLETRVATGGMLPPNQLGTFLKPRLAPEIVFKSTQVETVVRQSNALQLVFRGELSNGENKAEARVGLECLHDGPALRCQVHSHFPITALGLAVPRMLWVKAKNDVSIEGEVFFAAGPEGETK